MIPGSRLSEWPLGLDPARPARTLDRLEWICPGFVALAREAVARGRQATIGTRVVRGEPASLVERTGADYGPAFQHQSVMLVTDDGKRVELLAPRLEVVDGPHPEQPNVSVRRARVADPLRRMLKRGEIEARHRVAAEHLRRLYETGISPHLPSGLAPKVAGALFGGAYEYASDALSCRRKVQAAIFAVEPDGAAITFCVLSYGTLDGYSAANRIRRQDAGQSLRRGLEALAHHFGFIENTPEIEAKARA